MLQEEIGRSGWELPIGGAKLKGLAAGDEQEAACQQSSRRQPLGRGRQRPLRYPITPRPICRQHHGTDQRHQNGVAHGH